MVVKTSELSGHGIIVESRSAPSGAQPHATRFSIHSRHTGMLNDGGENIQDQNRVMND
jgi:hypothetical protein